MNDRFLKFWKENIADGKLTLFLDIQSLLSSGVPRDFLSSTAMHCIQANKEAHLALLCGEALTVLLVCLEKYT